MKSQFFVADAIQLDAHPAADSHVRRPVELLWRSSDQHLLDADCRGYHYRNVPIVGWPGDDEEEQGASDGSDGQWPIAAPEGT